MVFGCLVDGVVVSRSLSICDSESLLLFGMGLFFAGYGEANDQE